MLHGSELRLYLHPLSEKDGESIDKVLKKFKKKFERTQTMRQLRKRQSFTKPSVARRKEVIRATYKLTMQKGEE